MVNLPIEYSDKPVTPFGGMSLMKRFLDQTRIKEYLGTLDLPQPGFNRGYDPADIVTSFWLGIWTGATRYIHCDWLRLRFISYRILPAEMISPMNERQGAQLYSLLDHNPDLSYCLYLSYRLLTLYFLTHRNTAPSNLQKQYRCLRSKKVHL